MVLIRKKWLAGMMALALVFSVCGRSDAATFNYDSGSGKNCRFWIPDDISVIKGVIVYANGLGDDFRAFADDPDYQTLGRHMNFGVMGLQNFGNEMPGEGNRLLGALAHFASISNHPELKNVPLLLVGFSNGANFSYNFNAWMPSRVIAFAGNKSCCYGDGAGSIGTAARKTPGIFVFGENDTSRWDRPRSLMNTHRPQSALWSICMERGKAHEIGDADALFIPFFARAVAMRYPSDQSPLHGPVNLKDIQESQGWLVDQSSWGLKHTGSSTLTRIYSFSDFPAAHGTLVNDPVIGNIVKDGWVIDREVACNYRGFATYDHPITITSPKPVSSPNQSRRMISPVYQAGDSVTVAVDASGFADWTTMELWDKGNRIQQISAGGNTSFVLRNITPGIHDFTVVAKNNSGTERVSQLVTILVRGGGSSSPENPPADLPNSWKSLAIGTEPGGEAICSKGKYTVRGSGTDIWGGFDQFHFVYRKVQGDWSIVSRVRSQENTNPWAKAGVMMRELLVDSAKHAMLAVTPENGFVFQCRKNSGDTSESVNNSDASGMKWMKLQRQGSKFSAFRSVDGANWKKIGETLMDMANEIYIGIAVTSHDPSRECTVVFDSVRLKSR